ncbi:12420_t:CDS:2, partial [Acaulospora morrowiae]
RNVSMLQFYAYRIAQRNTFNPILWGGPLFQQYLVDAYVKVEETRLNYQRQNQVTLQSETYRDLSDYLTTAANERGVVPGRSSENQQQMLEYNEIDAFIESRYISAPEAYWRLSEYEMQEKSHSIVRLPVHLPDEQNLYFTLGEEQFALNKAKLNFTMLTAWFKLNEEDKQAREILYHDILLHYRFNQQSKMWQKRIYNISKVIG